MYVDLTRAYLVDYGTQEKLAQALNLSAPYIHYALKPFRTDPEADLRYAYWEDSDDVTLVDIEEKLKYLKIPSMKRARQIADTLCSDKERREVLLEHMRLAAVRRPAPTDPVGRIYSDELEEQIRAMGRVHSVALLGLDPKGTNVAYSQVWASVRQMVDRVDPGVCPIEFCQLLMFLHDAASVLNRHDLALWAARRALASLAGGRASGHFAERFRLNALLAEVVTLNNLRLRDEGMAVVDRAQKAIGYAEIEPEHWKRSFLEERLKLMTSIPRSSIWDAERIADESCCLAEGATQQRIGTHSRLLDLYVVRESKGNARRLAERLQGEELRHLRPQYGVRLARCLARYYRARSELEAAWQALSSARTIAISANLVHQAEEIERQAVQLAKELGR
ncbi:hypothetical protein [Streptomyces sp. SAI-144]|uniref:hypothetical protein n=1 Tax=Streptomyces sp. SAI-144 TaxID=2940544 RepID=UPI002473E712|nr:hypothetical protein [Streptomyces sp. SAI-144]